MRPKKVIELLEFAIPNNFSVLLKGTPGIGKTHMVQQAAKKLGYKLVTDYLSTLDPMDIKGALFSENGQARFLPVGAMKQIINTDEKIVFFFDDIGQGVPAVQAAMMNMLNTRMVGEHPVGDNVVFVAATNGSGDMAGVSYLLEPLKNRFKTIVEVEVHNDDWYEWARKNGMPFELIAFIRFRPELLNKFEPTKETVNSPTPRSIAAVGEFLNKGVPEHLQYEVFAGAAGEGFSAEFTSFLKIYKSLPDVDELLKDPENAKVPTEASIKYAVMSKITKDLNEENFDRAITLLNRMGVEYMLAAVTDSVENNPKLASSKSFVKWAVKYGDIYE